MKLKILILLLFVSLLWHNQLFGQCYWDNNKGINTPLGSTIQNFDWKTTNDYFVYTSSNQTVPTQIKSPFSGMSNANDNIQAFINQDVKDNDPAEGWELLIKNFGNPNDPYPYPTLVLYNRFIGIIRTFIFVPEKANFPWNTGKIEIRFTYPASVAKESALLSPLRNPQFALDKFVKKTVSNAVQRASYNTGLFWMYADFPVSYDPCSCNHFTQIDVRPNFVNIQKVDLTTSTKTSSVISGGSPGLDFSAISQPFDYFAKGIEAGNKRGASIGKSVGDISTFFDNYVLPNFAVKKTVLLLGPELNTDVAFTFTNSIKVPDFVKSNLGTAGIALGLIEYFVSGGKSTAMATPSVNYNITGTIVDSSVGQNTQIYVPGSPWANSGYGNAQKSKPHYNNTLGVFGLVETPKSQRSSIVNIPTQNGTNEPSSFKLRLNKNVIEDLKYVVNPSSNLIPVEIRTSLIATATFVQLKSNANLPSEPISSGSVNIVEHLPLPAPNQFQSTRTFTCSSPIMSFDCLKDYVLGMSLNDATLLAMRSTIQLNVVLKDQTTGKLYYYSSQYRLTPDDVADSSIPINDFSNIPLNISIGQLNLTSDLTLRAWQNIKLSGNINTNGFKLNLISGGKVDIGNISLSPNISIEIKTPSDCGDRTPQPMVGNLVQSFCGNPAKYNPVVPTLKGEDEDVSSLKSRKTVTMALSVAPNPFNNSLSIQYELQEPTQVTVNLSNALGQVVKVLVNEKVEAGSYQINESTADLPSGVYIVTMRTPTGIKTQKVVKQSN